MFSSPFDQSNSAVCHYSSTRVRPLLSCSSTLWLSGCHLWNLPSGWVTAGEEDFPSIHRRQTIQQSTRRATGPWAAAVDLVFPRIQSELVSSNHLLTTCHVHEQLIVRYAQSSRGLATLFFHWDAAHAHMVHRP